MNANTAASGEIRSGFCTRASFHGADRVPNRLAEQAVFGELLATLVQDPRAALRRSVEIGRSLCQAGAAGLSLRPPDGAGQRISHPDVVSGPLALDEGTRTSFSCGPRQLCLDAGTTILLSKPQRAFTYLSEVRPAVTESLIAPLYDGAHKPLGAMWIAHLEDESAFGPDDLHILEQLAIHVTLALKLLDGARQRDSALGLLEAQRSAHHAAIEKLINERSRRARAETSERTLQQALTFKDALIHEAHHRVRNTLQLVTSLLSMQERATSDGSSRTALREACTRLHLMAEVHELLYRSTGDTQQIHIPKLLQTIGNALRRSFAGKFTRVDLRISSDEVLLPANEAIALALLTNEVVTNAYKHAFPNGALGEISIDLRCTAENTVVLRIVDSGVGMQSRNVAEGGIGLKLLRTFAEQLQGTLTFSTPCDASGTAVTLTMPRTAASDSPGPATSDRGISRDAKITAGESP